MFENDAAGMSGRDDYLNSFPEAGGTILAQEATQFGQTDFRPALLKLADAKPDVMLVAITAGLLQMAQEYHQLGLKFTVAGTTFFADPPTIADPSSAGFVHTQLRIDAPPDLAAQFKAKYGVDMEFFAKQYYNAAQIVLTTLDKVLAENKPVTGENMHDTLLQIRKFQGLIPLEFKTNTASVPMDINIMRDGKDVTLKQTAIVAMASRTAAMLALQLLATGLVTGCALGVVAISFSLVYATTKIFHVAHAGIYTLGGYLAWSLVRARRAAAARAAGSDRGLHRARRADPEPALRAPRAAARDASGGADRLARRAGGDPEHHRRGLYAEHPAIPARVEQRGRGARLRCG